MKKKNILIVGSGKIGQAIGHILSAAKEYHILLADIDIKPLQQQPLGKNIELIALNIKRATEIEQLLNKTSIDAVVCCLPYHLTTDVADIAIKANAHYFDLTEDIEASEYINKVATNNDKAFTPHCGLAPGFINIVAHHLMQQFSDIETVKLRCGALPESTSNALQYALTWSTEGLINEYGNPSQCLIDGKITHSASLEDLEEIQIDGANYEAFNTSGGIGTLISTYQGKVSEMNYKTIRYPGHCDKMRFLMHGLKLNHDRQTLKAILEKAIPTTKEDVVLVYVSVSGKIDNQLTRKSFVKKYYPCEIHGKPFSAIQATTASSACAIIDLVLNTDNQHKGFICQEDFTLEEFLKNRFGKIFA